MFIFILFEKSTKNKEFMTVDNLLEIINNFSSKLLTYQLLYQKVAIVYTIVQIVKVTCVVFA
jgi:hypothetical protein